MKMKIGGIAAVLLATALLTGCGADDKAEVQKCIDQVEQTLADAGSDRDLTQDEIDACNDPEQRAFILGE